MAFRFVHVIGYIVENDIGFNTFDPELSEVYMNIPPETIDWIQFDNIEDKDVVIVSTLERSKNNMTYIVSDDIDYFRGLLKGEIK